MADAECRCQAGCNGAAPQLCTEKWKRAAKVDTGDKSGRRWQKRSAVLLRRIVKRFRGGLVFHAHRLLYHSTLGSREIKKEGKSESGRGSPSTAVVLHPALWQQNLHHAASRNQRLSHTMYELDNFGKSTPPQNRQIVVDYY